MITVSDAWKDIQQRFLLPETFVEIDVGFTDDEAQRVATAAGTSEAVFSNASSVVGTSSMTKYATNELNIWALDGTRTIIPSYGPYNNSGYVSNIASTGSVTLTFPTIQATAISGITITWSRAYGEYAKIFSVIGKNGENTISEVTVTDNTNQVSTVFISLENYNSVTVVVHEWSVPNHRVRIEKIVMGHMVTFSKGDLISFTHEQDGDLLSGKIPKYSIEFSLDNSDGRWDPNNPMGMAQYLSERQKLTVRYGLDINGSVEWIPAGVFYLSEWNAPPNGLEARFVARDVFEFLISVDLKGYRLDTLQGLIETAFRYNLPDDASVSIDPTLSEYTKIVDNGENTAAEIVQKCANAGKCIIRYGRDGVLHIEPMSKYLTDYRISSALSYSHPEVILSKPLKKVSVDYGEDTPYELSVFADGETQTVSNDFVVSEEQASQVAEWVRDILASRKTVSGEFRADPRLDLYDVVEVESKYGVLTPVIITNIKYTYNGSFKGSYTGRVLEVR